MVIKPLCIHSYIHTYNYLIFCWLTSAALASACALHKQANSIMICICSAKVGHSWWLKPTQVHSPRSTRKRWRRQRTCIMLNRLLIATFRKSRQGPKSKATKPHTHSHTHTLMYVDRGRLIFHEELIKSVKIVWMKGEKQIKTKLSSDWSMRMHLK